MSICPKTEFSITDILPHLLRFFVYIDVSNHLKLSSTQFLPTHFSTQDLVIKFSFKTKML